MKIKVWGTRGSIPSPLTPDQVRAKIRTAILGLPDIDTQNPDAVDAYLDQIPVLLSGTAGGNTTCIEIQVGSDTFIIDAGSGLRELGQELMKGPCGRGQGTLHLLFTHAHWDHILGFPFFRPAFTPGNQIFIYSVHNLNLALENQQNPLNFPIPLSAMQANLKFIPITPGQPFSIGKTSINSIKTFHPGDAYAYRFETERSVFVFASDAEYQQLDEASLKPYIDFFQNADVLFFDAQYTLAEAWQKTDWGHSSAMIGADIARKAGAKRLVLFHHDPTYSDMDLLKIQQETIEYQAQDPNSPPCEVIVAYEGLEIDLSPSGSVNLQRLAEGAEAIFTPTGKFDEQGVASLEEQLNHWHAVGWPSRLVIDLSKTETLTVAGLKLLISLRKEKADTVIALAGPSEPVRQVIELAGFADYFALYPTVEAASAALQAAEALNLPGQLIGRRYRIERRLSDSWQGAVFLATDIYNNRKVALTILSAAFSEKAIDELIRQAWQLTGLEHPNIAAVLDCGEDRNISYIVEEFLEGPNLSQVLSNERVAPAQAKNISLAILSALEYVHNRGIIHYNVTPRNIFITNEVKVTNFGLGNLERGRQLLERPLILLEAAYLAPEQILGHSPDARTDLYALGVIMYELFVGCPPFTGPDQEVMQAHLHQSPTSPGDLNPNLSRSLEYLILKLLAKNPDERYVTAHQTRQILAGVVVGQQEDSGLSDLLYREQQPLVGRENELKQMEAARAMVQQYDTPHLLIIRGAMGIGKSRLVSEFLLRCIVDHNFTAIVGRCDELGAPYTPYAQILTTIFNKGFVSPQLIADQVKHLTRQIPGLASILSPFEADDVSQPSANPRQAQWYFFETFLLILANLGPTVLVIEDAAQLDAASIALTRFLIRRAQIPLLIIVSGRDDEEANPWLTAFQSDKREVIHLQSLSLPAIEAYLKNLLGNQVSPAVVATAQKRTQGNPYFIEEITNHFRQNGVFYQNDAGLWLYDSRSSSQALPPTLMQLFAQRMEKLAESRRIEDLTDSARQALAVAATIGPEFDFDIWAATLDMINETPEALALDALDEAFALGLVKSLSQTRYAFESVDIADVLVSTLSDPLNQTAHRCIAEAMGQKEGDPLLISYHYQEAKLTTEAARYLEMAGAKAMAAHNLDEAITYYDQAILLAESQTGYETLGDLYRQKSAYGEAIRAYQQALKLAEQDKDTLGMAHILNGLSPVLWLFDRFEEARQAAAQVLELSKLPDIEYASAKYHLGLVFWAMGRLDEAEDWCRQAIDTFIKHQNEERLIRAYYRLGLVYASKGEFSRSSEALNHALEIARKLNDERRQGMCLNYLGQIAAEQGKFESAWAAFIPAQELLEKINDSSGLMELHTHQAQMLLWQNQGGEALLNLTRALDHAEQSQTPSAYKLTKVYLLAAQIHLNNNNLEQARLALDKALELIEDIKSLEQTAIARATLAQIHAAEGDNSTAEVLFHTSMSLFERVGSRPSLLRTRLAYARFLAAHGRSNEASNIEQKVRREAGEIGLYL